MKTKTDDIDKLIEQALSKEEADYYKQLDDQSVPEMLAGLYRGKLAWMGYLTGVIIAVAFGFSIYCAVKFFQTDSVEMMLKWGAGVFVGLIWTSMLKLWNWLQMDKNTLIRHIKYLEFQISVLATKIDK